MIFLLKGFALLLPPIRTLICIELMLGRLRICKPKRFAKLPAKPTTIQRQTTQALTCRLFMLSCFFCDIPCISISVIYHLSALLKHPKTETFHQKRVVTFFCIFFYTSSHHGLLETLTRCTLFISIKERRKIYG